MGNHIASMYIKLYKMLGFSFKNQAFCVHITLKILAKYDF